jgi:hypothetical protein
MKLTLFFTVMLLPAFLAAQQNRYDAYQNESIGWKKIYNFPPAIKSQQVDDKVYSAALISVTNLLANWIQMSYLPKGGLGDVKKTVLPKIGLYNAYNAALPPSYGAVAHIYTFLKKENGKWVNETTHANLWRIMANQVPDYPITDLCNENQYYFVLPGMDKELITRQGRNENNYSKLYDLSSIPGINQFFNVVLPEFGHLTRSNLIIMSKDNQFPFHQLTIGELLSITENTMQYLFDKDKKTLAEQNQGMPTDYTCHLNTLKEKHDKAKATIAPLRAKYKNQLSDPAYLEKGNFDITDLANGADILAGLNDKIKTIYPVYRVKPEVLKLCKTDNPQWISISWDGGSMDEPAFRHMHESIINNFNFGYLYNYFFDSEKVKGIDYSPLKTPR